MDGISTLHFLGDLNFAGCNETKATHVPPLSSARKLEKHNGHHALRKYRRMAKERDEMSRLNIVV
jgi:hypothetical protein